MILTNSFGCAITLLHFLHVSVSNGLGYVNFIYGVNQVTEYVWNSKPGLLNVQT
jgi:hypothetical protein